MKSNHSKNRLPFLLLATLVVIILFFVFKQRKTNIANREPKRHTWWEFQAVDTMKYSRDVAWEKLNDKSFDKVIDTQVKNIADVGATHVAIATPYDERFLPFLKRWVNSARNHNLKVWFRGNWSGWEGWFGYSKINREEHLKLTRNFIIKNQDLFQEGDYFTACPECENGGPGNPFVTGDMDGHIKFLIDEYNVSKEAFQQAGKNVQVNLHSMNGDVAKFVFTPENTVKLGGVVTIDHYVKTPKKLDEDVTDYSKRSKAPVILGEYGAPIPDLHGDLDEDGQAKWINDSLLLLSKNTNLKGISYWTGVGGSTQLWSGSGAPRKAVEVLKKFFTPYVSSMQILDDLGNPIEGVLVASSLREQLSDKDGFVDMPIIYHEDLKISRDGYESVLIHSSVADKQKITLKKDNPDFYHRVRLMLKDIAGK